ncbi:hypothetical protein SAMN02927900_01705 [Rhizobium mongolense subsp. loessense]|uniref:Uncharacterized protein n=1 Tax=Rhizobium mongolense subsp. loessense TaxID=158890 RepID=A0A1G4QPN3_9HYPH|nr:hypothetical protein SAMN02927900_01705 [Rhizobium mongolense subsp. loessense]
MMKASRLLWDLRREMTGVLGRFACSGYRFGGGAIPSVCP